MTWRSREVSVSKCPRSASITADARRRGAVALDADINGVEQVLIAKRLGQEFDRAGLHGAHRHRDVAVPGDEDDREVEPRLRDFALEIEPAQARHADVEHQAAGRVGPLEAQEFLRRGEGATRRRTERIRLSSASRSAGSSSTTKTKVSFHTVIDGQVK